MWFSCWLLREFFRGTENIVHPHPYVDAPWIEDDNKDDPVPPVTLEELLSTVKNLRKKKSVDAHGLNNFMFNFLHPSHWTLLFDLFNRSFSSAFFPNSWKDTRILLIAKREQICQPSLTRPISLLDVFQKVCEKLFLNRFSDVLHKRGLLPDIQSGFRSHFRLQTRLLLFLDDLYSALSNSTPSVTVFIDFRNAFDMLWQIEAYGHTSFFY